MNTYFILFYILIAGGQVTDGHIDNVGASLAECEKEASTLLTKLSEPHPQTGLPVFFYIKVWCMRSGQP